MSPMQTLSRLAELTRRIAALPTGLQSNAEQHRELLALEAERDYLVAAVPAIPPELSGCSDPHIWAMILVDRWGGQALGELPAGMLELWFNAALTSSYQRGLQEGQTLGTVAERSQRTITHQLLVDRLGLIARLLAERRMVDLRLRGETEGAPMVQLSALVDEALVAAGATL